MAHLRFRGVNDAFYTLVKMFQDGRDNGDADVPNEDRMLPITKKPSRVGDVLQIDEPMTITFTHPRERVLFNNTRDANPFFHLFESLWMLAGRNDIKPLEYYSSKIADFCSDDGLTANGAYGMRWRAAKSPQTWVPPEFRGENDMFLDQLKVIIDQLKRKPESRRVVLQMWNVEDDLLKIDVTKDVCCNTAAYFSIRTGKTDDSENPATKSLDMTVTNRSNDLILGMLGANVVHFSFLQEYIATALGVDVGVYNQFTNNLHVYTEANGGFKPEEWLNDPIYEAMDVEYHGNVNPYQCEQGDHEDGVKVSPYLIGSMRGFDEEVKQFIDNPYQCWGGYVLNHVAKPMCEAFRHHKARQYGLAEEALSRVAAEDWRGAGRLWIKKRQKNWESKKGSE